MSRYFSVKMNKPEWTAVPAQRSSLLVLKARLYILLGALLLASCFGLFSAIAWLTAETPQPDYAIAKPVAAGLAELIAKDFLDARPATYPVAEGIEKTLRSEGRNASPIEYFSLIPDRWERETIVGTNIESHRFLVSTSQDVMALTIIIGIDTPVPTLLAYPSLEPAFVKEVGEVPSFEYQSVPGLVERIPKPVVDAVNTWADAFASDNQEQLRQIVGDPTAQAGDYKGIGGYISFGTAELRTVVSTVNGFVIRTRLVLEDSSAEGTRMRSDYDLLVTQVETNLPKVVAWGPPGSGPNLTTYQNRR